LLAARYYCAVSALCFTQLLHAQGLQTSYDGRGLTKLSYNGVSLVDLNARLGDAFYVGSYNLGGNGGWGGIGNSVNWNPSSQTLTWSWNWGRVSCQFATPFASNNLNVTLTVTNSSGQTLNGIDIYPFGLQFPNLPPQFGNANYPQFHNNLDGPSLIPADFGAGMLTLVDNDAKPLFLGFSPSGAANHYALVAGTMNDSIEGFLATAIPVNRPIASGQTDVFSFSLRFSPSGTDYHAVAADVLATYGQTWPETLNWTDRRPIGELFLTNPSSAALSNSSPNPRNYTVAQNINIQNPQGLAAFQAAVLAYADNSVKILKSMNAQGAIVWDLEGQQYPQPDTSYVGDPTQLPVMAPEMNGIADAFFAKFTNAGLKCGMTLRPQQLDFSVSPPNQNSVPVGNEAGVLIQKIQYAYNRWGCTIFYVDSDGGPSDATAPATFGQVLQALPQVLVIPENIWTKDSAYTAPLASFWAPYKPLHTTADEKTIWPNSFTVTYIGDAPNHDLSNNPNNPNQWNEMVSAVAGGDILSFRAWFDDQPLNNQVLEIYQAAADSSEKSKKPKTSVSISVTPVTSALIAGQTEQFTATVTGTTNQAVNWTVSPAGVGTISATGLYMAPAAIAAQQTVTVGATSVADPTKSAAAAIALNPVVGIFVTPATGALNAGQTLRLTATVSGTTNQGVNWTVSPAGMGSVSPAGLYTAPAAVATQQPVSIQATSMADLTKSAAAVVTLNPPAPAPAPSCPAPATDAFTGCYYLDQTFGATQGLGFSRIDPQISFDWGANGPGSGLGANNFSVRWQGSFTFAAGTYTFSVSTDDGSILYIDGKPVINDWGVHPAYTITQSVNMSSGSHLVQLDYYQAAGLASAKLSWTAPQVNISVTPATGTVAAGQTLQLAASVTGTPNSQVNWTVSPQGVGSVSSSGLYTAPASVTAQQTVTVQATSAVDATKSATAALTLTPPAVAPGSCPAPATNAFTGCYYLDQTFGATRGLAFSHTDPQISFNWGANGPGSGIGPYNFSVRWQGYFTFAPGAYTFNMATDDGSVLYIDGQPVINDWSDHPARTITQPVVMSGGTHLIQLDYYQSGGGASASLSWTSPAIAVNVTPSTIGMLSARQTLQLTTSVSGTSNQGVNWTVSPAGMGTVSASGLYTAPAAVNGQETITVKATSVADSSKSATANITLNPAPGSASCPAPAVNAFTGCYYSDKTFGASQGLAFTRTDPRIAFNWANGPGSGVGAYNFSVRWQGYFTFAAGTYTFSVATDDGSMLYIDGQPVLNEWGDHPAYTLNQPVVMSAGQHLVQLDYYQAGGGASANLTWTNH